MKKSEIFILGLILIVAALLRFPLIAQGFFAFTYDQGRDLLAVRDIVNNFNPTLIGPTTGLPGIFYGPWWYYFLSPIFFISDGNPVTITLILATIGEITILLLYLLSKKLTKNIPVSLGTAVIAAMSQPFITSSSQIWSPSLVLPLMLIYIYCAHMIFQNPKPIWFLALGLSAGSIADSGAAFGVVLIFATILASTFFKKQFFQKSYLFFFIGLLLVLLPRIIFDLRNDFLITKSIINWLSNPLVYQEQLSFTQRLTNRVELFLHAFAQTFSQSDKLLSLVPLLFTVISIIIARDYLAKNKMFKFLLSITLLIYFGFSLYPDAVWDYYLVGLPLIFLTTLALATSQLQSRLPVLTSILLLLTVLVNFNQKLLSPFSITWQGDGAIFKNQIIVLEALEEELKGNYSLYVYTPARNDYPFDYLIWWYSKRTQIDQPEENQKRLYLIIRDDSSQSYLTTGWYGDKLRDNTKLLQKITYPGNLIVEKHIRNE